MIGSNVGSVSEKEKGLIEKISYVQDYNVKGLIELTELLQVMRCKLGIVAPNSDGDPCPDKSSLGLFYIHDKQREIGHLVGRVKEEVGFIINEL